MERWRQENIIMRLERCDDKMRTINSLMKEGKFITAHFQNEQVQLEVRALHTEMRRAL